MGQQDELYKRLRQISQPYERPHVEQYLEGRGVGFSRCRGFPYFVDFDARINKNPDVSLAVIDLVEELKEFGSPQMFLQMRHDWAQFPYKKRFCLRVRAVSKEAHHLAAQLEAVVDRIAVAYGRGVMRKLELDISVIEEPIYVSPRLGLKALEAAKEGEHASMRDVMGRLNG